MAETSMFFNIFGRDQGVGDMFDNVAGRGSGVTKALAGIGLAAAGLGLGKVLRTGYEEATQAQSGIAQLEAGIKSTGGAAGVTVGELEELASTIQNYSGQTDDSIMKTESLLLTFTRIRNVGPDRIFDDATRAAADMAAKFGGDASEQAIVLGKALNDPIRGLTALRRVGIQFTDSQEAQIKAMANSGNIMGAQKIILGELTTEFGGAAAAAGKTLPGQLAIASRSFEDISQSLVEGLLPVLQNLMTGVQGVMNWFKGLSPEMRNVVVVIAAVIAVGLPLVLLIGSMSTGILSLIAVIPVIGGALSALWTVLMANPIFLVIGMIAAFVASLVFAYNNVGWFRDFVNSAFSLISDVISNVISFISGVLIPLLVAGWNRAGQMAQVTGAVIGAVWSMVVSVVSGAVNGVIGFVQNLGSTISGIWNGIVSNTGSMVGQVIGFFGGLPGRILGAIGNLGGLLVGIGGQIIGGLISGIQGALGGLGDVLGSVGKFIADNKGPEEYDRKLLVPHGGWVMSGLTRGIRESLPDLLGTLDAVTGTISGQMSGAALSQVGVSTGPRGSGGGSRPIYVQNPFTGEYLLAKVDDRAGAAIDGVNDDIYRRRAR